MLHDLNPFGALTMRYTYRPLDESIEARRKAAMDVLGALLFAMWIFLPVYLWFVGFLP